MDEPWGMVAAAVVAGVLGIGGVLLGLLVGRRQVSDQAQVEHGQWLRGQRLQSYLEFLHAWDAALSALSDTQEDWPAELEVVERDGHDETARRMQAQVASRINDAVADAVDAGERAALVATPVLGDQLAETLRRLMLLSSGLHSRARHRPDEPQWPQWNRGASEAVEARKAFFRLAKEDLETVPKPGTARGARGR